MEKETEVKTVAITIQVVTMGNTKMTKSVFNQLEHRNPFDKDLNFLGDRYLGYVNDKEKYLLWIDSGKLRRYRLSHLEKLARLRDSSYVTKSVEDTLWELKIKYTSVGPENIHKIEAAFNESEDYEHFNRLRTTARTFLRNLDNFQLFISR